MNRGKIQRAQAHGPVRFRSRRASAGSPAKRLLGGALLSLLIVFSGNTEELPVLKMAYSAGLFDGVNLGAVQTITRFWVDRVGGQKNICRAGEIRFCEGADAWRAAAEEKSFTLGILLVPEFLQLEAENLLDPCFVFMDAGGAGSELLLIRHCDDQGAGLSDLAGQKLLFAKGPYEKIARMWVDSLLADKGFATSQDFFGAILEQEKTNDAVSSLLGSRNGACVVTRDCFETMTLLNPQIGKKLVVLAQSPNFVPTVICILRDSDPELGANVRSALGTFREDPVGRQLLMTFNFGGFRPYEPGLIQATRTLFEAHRQRPEPPGISLGKIKEQQVQL